MKLWLDDVREAPDGWLWCKKVEEALDLLESFEITEISFDHDLGYDMSGYDLACWIEREATLGLPRLTWKVHSANPVGRKRIEAAMIMADRYWDAAEATYRRHNTYKKILQKHGKEFTERWYVMKNKDMGDMTPLQHILNNKVLTLEKFVKRLVEGE